MSVSIFIRKTQFCSSFFSEMKFPLFERNVFYAQVFWPSDSLRLSLQCCCQSLPLLTEETLTPVDVFVLVSFNNMLTLCIGTYLGLALLEGYEAYASLGRIEEFLLLKKFASHFKRSLKPKRNRNWSWKPIWDEEKFIRLPEKTERSFHSWWITRSNVITCEKFGVQASGATRLLFFKISSFALRLVV